MTMTTTESSEIVSVFKNIAESHNISRCVYHIVWTPKRRKDVLVNEVAMCVETSVQEKCEREGWLLGEVNTHVDHVHVYVQLPVGVDIAEVTKQLKGYTSFRMGQEFPMLKASGGSPWSAGFYVNTSSEDLEEQIVNYIEYQDKHRY